MTNANLKKFLVLYLVPQAVIADWQKTDPEIRKPAEDKMRAGWGTWMAANGSMILSTEVGGKTKRVTTGGIADHKNDVMLYSFVQAQTHDEAAKPFASHPHLDIPQASIEVMEVRAM
jgi:hypothetical protein